jgi:hypothetical protein
MPFIQKNIQQIIKKVTLKKLNYKKTFSKINHLKKKET